MSLAETVPVPQYQEISMRIGLLNTVFRTSNLAEGVIAAAPFFR